MKSYLMLALFPALLSPTAVFAAGEAKEVTSCSDVAGCKDCSGKNGHCKGKEGCTCEKKCECGDCDCSHSKKAKKL